MTEQPYGCRLMPKEREYLEKYYDSFSDYVHDSFKRDIMLTKNNRKKNKLQLYSQSIVMMAIGAMFLFVTPTQRSLIGMIMVFLIGVFFCVWGGISLLYERKEK